MVVRTRDVFLDGGAFPQRYIKMRDTPLQFDPPLEHQRTNLELLTVLKRLPSDQRWAVFLTLHEACNR